jgi:PAS domain S-box-containing protein
MENAEAIQVQPNSGTTMGPTAACSFSGCIMPAMASSGLGSERLNAQLLVDSIPALIHTARPDGYLDYFNKPWLEYLGVTLDKVTGWNWTAFVHPEDVEGILAKWRACLATGEVFEYETRVRSANGEYRWMFHRKVPLRDANGNIVKWYGSSLDIEERKTAEEQLRRNSQELQRSESYLAEGQRLAHMGSWAFDPDGFYYWSPELFRMHGLDPASKPPSVLEYLDRVHPQDRESMADLIKGILAKASTFDATKRIVRPNGEVRYIRCVGAPVVENQSLKRYVGSAIDVTEHELLTQELRRREAYLTEAQRLSHTGSFGWRPDTGEIVWSDETYRIFEYNPAEKPTVSMVLQRAHPQDRALVQQVIENVSKSGTDFEHEYRLVMQSEVVKHVHVRAHALRDSSGNIEFVGAVTDITERKAAEEALRSSETYLAEAQRLSQTGSWAWNAATGEPRYWSEECYRVLGFDPAEPPPLLEAIFQRILPEERAAIREQFDRAIRGKADFELDLRFVHPITGIRNIRSTGHAVLDRYGDLREIVGTVIDITDRKRAEEALRRSESYLAEAQKVSHTGSFGWNVCSGDIHWSRETFRIFEYEPAAKAAIDMVLQRTHPEDRSAVKQLIDHVSRERTEFDFEHRLLMPDGSVKYLRVMGSPSENEDGCFEFVGAVTDITERKRAGEALRLSESYLAEAQRLTHTGSWVWEVERRDAVHLSEEWYRIYGFDPAEGMPGWEKRLQRVHPEDRAKWQEVIERAIRKESDYEMEYRVLLPGDVVKYIRVVGHPVLDSSGEVLQFVGSSTDITESKRAEEALRSGEAYLAEAQRLSKTGSWAWSPDQDIRYWSEECYRVLSFDPQDGLPRFEEFFQRIHPDDQPGFRELIQTAIREKSEWQADYRIVHPGGAIRDIHVVGHPVLSTSGHLVEFVGTVIDVTERKQAEEELRRSEMELRQIVDLVPQLVAVFGPGGERLYANRVALNHVGLSLEEWRQTAGGIFRPGWFIHPDDRERAARAYSDSARSGYSAYELELRVQAADGSYRWFLVRFNPVRDEHGQIMRWYVAATDIEDRKQAEDTLHRENVALREEVDKASMFEEIVGTSPALKAVLSRISKVAPSDSTVLITGETGTGKELVARAIHRLSDRVSRPFVSVNCAAIPRDLIASELFGHEKGAFTGATQQRLGRFELASGGTIFLDEVGELPAETQIALLRVLQEHEFERVGGTRQIHADVRVIAATNRDLQAAISAGSFRSDLFYRLHVFPIEIPPLRERKEDILLLVEYFIDRYARKAGKNITTVDKKTLRLLESYPWPGNIRELQNVIERSIIVCETATFSVDESWLSQQPLEKKVGSQLYLSEKVAAQEKELIEAALRESQGRVFGPLGAAAKLGIARSTLESKIRSLKINKSRFKA